MTFPSRCLPAGLCTAGLGRTVISPICLVFYSPTSCRIRCPGQCSTFAPCKRPPAKGSTSTGSGTAPSQAGTSSAASLAGAAPGPFHSAASHTSASAAAFLEAAAASAAAAAGCLLPAAADDASSAGRCAWPRSLRAYCCIPLRYGKSPGCLGDGCNFWAFSNVSPVFL